MPLLGVVPLRDIFGEMAFKEYFARVHSSGSTCVLLNRNIHNRERGKNYSVSSGTMNVLLIFKQTD